MRERGVIEKEEAKKFWSEMRHVFQLSFSLAQVRFKLRNEGSFVGFFWYLLEPLMSFVILLLCGHALRQSAIPLYPL